MFEQEDGICTWHAADQDPYIEYSIYEVQGVYGTYYDLRAESGTLEIVAQRDSLKTAKLVALASREAILFWSKRAGELLAEAKEEERGD